MKHETEVLERPLPPPGTLDKLLNAKPAKRTIKAKAGTGVDKQVQIQPPNFQKAAIRIRGDAPLVMHAFSAKQQAIIEETQAKGSLAKKDKKKAPKDFSALYERARHRAKQGWDGIPATAFRLAAIAACRTVGYPMTTAKMSIFVEADGYEESGTPLVKITKGKPREHRGPVRNATGVIDIRARPMWEPGWEAVVRVRWDADQFTAAEVANLMARAGAQVGICEGRPFSSNSAGCGWGTFEVLP